MIVTQVVCATRARLMPFLLQLAETIGWSVLAVVLFYGSLRLFDILDPIDYQAEIRRGNIAASLILASTVLAISGIIITVLITP